MEFLATIDSLKKCVKHKFYGNNFWILLNEKKLKIKQRKLSCEMITLTGSLPKMKCT